ncbi:hypothetical protein ARMGADRAFT_1020066 [Armillaria gallica]|uniref:Zinc finger PHD-type domain-containing protein n=1 Tax=Armillaria gallica TaxID=47427 RepID=A0A2H3CIK3_ARMGA|nr:hypothetical protein ARMGADRAFT_1020066 [Armillaria gallica]
MSSMQRDDQHWRCDNPQNDTIPFTDVPRTRSGRTRRARDLHAVLRTCVCSKEIDCDQIDEGVIACKQEGCETGLYHMTCVGLGQRAGNWVCESREAARPGKKRRR